MKLLEYLGSKLKKSTTEKYYDYIEQFISYTTKERAIKATYKDILDYLSHLRKRYNNPRTIISKLYGIKQYYQWLIDTHQRQDHPCKSIKLRDVKSKSIQLQDLFSTSELELLLEVREYYKRIELTSKIIISMLIYQGLTCQDLLDLTITDINLQKATVYIKAGTKTNSRTLLLKASQIILIHEYLTQARPELLKTTTDKLLITMIGTEKDVKSISYLIQRQQHVFPDRKLTPTTIRMSVIANLLKEGKNIREVQIFAGHKYASTTQKYKQSHIEELKADIQKHHPLQ